MASKPGRLLQALKDGQAARLSKECKSQNELAGKLGLSSDAFLNQKVRLISKGVMVPSFAELQAMPDEPQPNRWPNLTAFDEQEIPLDPIPERHAVKGVSTLLDPEGNVIQQWIKTSAVNDERAAWLEAVREIVAPLPRIEPLPAPDYRDSDLLAVFPVGDPHVGLLAWHEDAGENFDLKICLLYTSDAADERSSVDLGG